MKQAGTPSPYLPVVDQKGNIKHLYYSQNAGHTFLEIYQGQAVLNAAGRREGYTALGDLYEKDPNPIVREKGLAYYREYDLACRQQKVETEEVQGATPGSVKRRPVPFPDKWLPQEVRDRRAGTSDVSPKGWSPDSLPDIEDEPEAKPAPKAKAKTKPKAAASA